MVSGSTTLACGFNENLQLPADFLADIFLQLFEPSATLYFFLSETVTEEITRFDAVKLSF